MSHLDTEVELKKKCGNANDNFEKLKKLFIVKFGNQKKTDTLLLYFVYHAIWFRSNKS